MNGIGPTERSVTGIAQNNSANIGTNTHTLEKQWLRAPRRPTHRPSLSDRAGRGRAAEHVEGETTRTEREASPRQPGSPGGGIAVLLQQCHRDLFAHGCDQGFLVSSHVGGEDGVIHPRT